MASTQDMDQKPETEVVEAGTGETSKGTENADRSTTTNIPAHLKTEAILARPDRTTPKQGLKTFSQSQHPMYRTTSHEYGSKLPSLYSLPTCFHTRSNQFSQQQGVSGMYKNHSLNTAVDPRCTI
ncbi:UPF0691 protein C9orf116 homolog [Gigantopelta aegis]|uniref:UPF0691 protein C9orf116 homolog n=1 Tax=Gigantopelta aegis TaxID=1735272 RepID=UPI001B88DF16|nr:UPF0691 protein C9orf116 homolog [Gigantopelta aegis]